MLRKTWWTAALLVAALATPAPGQVKLVWKLKAKDKFYLETTQNIRQTVEVMGRSLKNDITSTIVSRFTVKKSTKAGLVLEQKFESVKLSNTGDFGDLDPEKVAQQMKGAAFTITLDAANKVAKFEGYEKLLEKLTEENKDARKLYEKIYPKESFQRAVAEMFSFLPAKAVSKGGKWQRTETVPVGPSASLGSFKTEITYTYLEKIRRGVKIDVSAKATYMPPKGEGSSPLKITKGDFKRKNFEGTIVFDPIEGRLVRSEMKSTVKGTLTMEVRDREEVVTVELETETTSRGTKERPVSED